MNKKKKNVGQSAPARTRPTFKTLDELFAAVLDACANEWQRDFGARPGREAIESWCAWAKPKDNEAWARHRQPHAVDLEARRIHAEISAALLRLEPLTEEARRALDKRTSLLHQDEDLPSDAALERVDALLTERERALIYSKLVGDLSTWVASARRQDEQRVERAFQATGIRFAPTFAQQPWVDVSAPSVRLQAALHVLVLSPWSAVSTSEGARDGLATTWKPRVDVARTDRQAALMSLLGGTRPASIKPSNTVASVIIAETKAMRLAIRRGVIQVTQAITTLHGEVAEESAGDPIFTGAETTSRLQKRTMTYEMAMYQSVAVMKIHEVLSSVRRFIGEQLAPADRAAFEAAVASAEAANVARIDRLRGKGYRTVMLDRDGEIVLVDESGEVKPES